MELRPIFSTLMRNKTGAILIALQVALTLAIVSNALFIITQRLEIASRPSGVDDEGQVFEIGIATLNDVSRDGNLRRRQPRGHPIGPPHGR